MVDPLNVDSYHVDARDWPGGRSADDLPLKDVYKVLEKLDDYREAAIASLERVQVPRE